jgi:hypothetical protein
LILDVNNEKMPSEKSKASIKEVRFQSKLNEKYENCLGVLKTVNDDLDEIHRKIPATGGFKNHSSIIGIRGGSIDTAVEFQSVL